MSKTISSLPKNFLDTLQSDSTAPPYPDSIGINDSLENIFLFARACDASDIHLAPHNPIIFRRYGTLQAQTENPLTADIIEKMTRAALPDDIIADLEQSGDREHVLTLTGGGRFRITLMKQRFGWDLTARVVPENIHPFDKSGLPPSCRLLTEWAQGLILITGPAGCGKTSTLATLVDMINQTRYDHIITIENPIEIVYTPQKCQITQREINRHTLSQINALRAALREDPDIIVVSELRDLDSIQLAVTAAETGHLVLGTMNTNDAVQTLSTLIYSFPPEEQSIISSMIAESLRGVISQQLIPRKDGSGVIPAYEVLMLNTAAANLIRVQRLQQIYNVIATGKKDGMVLLDHSLQALIDQGLIDGRDAHDRAVNPKLFEEYIHAGDTNEQI
ncbi:MAG: PilT/PilU family type 4a pilus ATPase [Candidatus Omnitrophica bacterium]|nr:PilT/PilU family type 4a pilus ATPase [Candidatus Omnitrophota bacterium]